MTSPNNSPNAQEHIHESDGSTANPSKLICRRCGETYSYDTNVANSLKTSDTQNAQEEVNPFIFSEAYPDLDLGDFNAEEAYEMGVAAAIENKPTKENTKMSNSKAESAIHQLFRVEDLIKESDFTGLVEENDNGYRERAVEHIKKAAQEIDAMRAAEDEQAS